MASPFLALPAELRNTIYEIYTASATHPQTLILHGSSPAHFPPPPLAHVSRQTRSEFLTIWKTLNTANATRLRVFVHDLDLRPLSAFLDSSNPRHHSVVDVRLIFRFTDACQIARHGKLAVSAWPDVDFTRISGLCRLEPQPAPQRRPREIWLPPPIRCLAELDWVGLGGDVVNGRYVASTSRRRVPFYLDRTLLVEIVRRAKEVRSEESAGKRARERAFRTWLKLKLCGRAGSRG